MPYFNKSPPLPRDLYNLPLVKMIFLSYRVPSYDLGLINGVMRGSVSLLLCYLSTYDLGLINGGSVSLLLCYLST